MDSKATPQVLSLIDQSAKPANLSFTRRHGGLPPQAGRHGAISTTFPATIERPPQTLASGFGSWGSEPFSRVIAPRGVALSKGN